MIDIEKVVKELAKANMEHQRTHIDLIALLDNLLARVEALEKEKKQCLTKSMN